VAVRQRRGAAAGPQHPGDDIEIPGGAEVVGFTSWRERLVTRPQGRVTGLGDVARRGLRLVNREPGAQARPWLLAQLASLPGYDPARCGERSP
jgi:hypothetical protein